MLRDVRHAEGRRTGAAASPGGIKIRETVAGDTPRVPRVASRITDGLRGAVPR